MKLNTWPLAVHTVTVLLWLLCFVAVLWLTGCASNREERAQENTVEVVETVVGPVIADVPLVGQVVIQPVRHVMQRKLDVMTTSTEERRISVPEVGAIIQAAPVLAGPLGIAGTILGCITTAAAGWMANRRGKTAREEAAARELAERQRDETVDGIEAAKGKLSNYGGAWEALTEQLERKQSRDTVNAVKARVG